MAKNDVLIDAGIKITSVETTAEAKKKLNSLRSIAAGYASDLKRLEQQASGRMGMSAALVNTATQQAVLKDLIRTAKQMNATPESLVSLTERLNTQKQKEKALKNKEKIVLAAERREAAWEQREARGALMKEKRYKKYLQDVDYKADLFYETDRSDPMFHEYARNALNASRNLLRNPDYRERLIQEGIGTKRYEEIIKDTKKELRSATAALKQMRSTLIAGAGGIAFGSYVSNQWGAIRADRNTPFERQWELFNKGVQYGVGAAGAIAGGTLGSLAGPLGTAIGASVGGALGSFLGGVLERDKRAADSSKLEAVEMLRNRNLYGSIYGLGYNMSKLISQSGYMTQQNYTDMARGAGSFKARALLGQISDDEWLALYMNPNYFRSLWNEENVTSQLTALREDQKNLPSTFGQWSVGALSSTGLNEDVRAFVNSDIFPEYLRNRGVSEYRDWLMYQSAPGFEYAKYDVGTRNMREAYAQYALSTRDPNILNFNRMYGAELRPGEYMGNSVLGSVAATALDSGVTLMEHGDPVLGLMLKVSGVLDELKKLQYGNRSTLIIEVDGTQTTAGEVIIPVDSALYNYTNSKVGSY